ncbi:MAG: bifunctional 5,10-methylenetetrahydrofolate dehydrogenase/5,10-methenyltetrahydrofolate cyclohydrolase, partial [Myxococcota bacterium]
ASQVYVRRKGIVADRLGYFHQQINLPADTPMNVIVDHIDRLNADDRVDGILVQLPLPKGLEGRTATERIHPDKDVDGLTTRSAGRLVQGRPYAVPCTPKGVMRLIESAELPVEGKSAVVIGRSNLVGRPIAALLEQANATVTVCHSRTVDLPAIVERSDIVVAAIGRPEHVKGAWIKEGAVVIDVGVNRMPDGSLKGDVEFEAAKQRASAITPVPGGVGPMTIAMLMENTFEASARRQGGSAS